MVIFYQECSYVSLDNSIEEVVEKANASEEAYDPSTSCLYIEG